MKLNGGILLFCYKNEEIFRNIVIKYYYGFRMSFIVYLVLYVFILKLVILEIKCLDIFYKKKYKRLLYIS